MPTQVPSAYLCTVETPQEVQLVQVPKEVVCCTCYGRADSKKNKKMEYGKLIELANAGKEISVTIKVQDLKEMVDYCVNKTKTELEQQITIANAETYPSVEDVSQLLGVNKSTLWRWAKKGYLAPIEVGGKRKYRMSDVKRMLGGDNSNASN